jgi:hypothetical protein
MTLSTAPDTTGPDLFDYAASQALKAHGTALTLDAQAMDWSHGYTYHAERFLNALPPRSRFIGEDLRKYLLPKIGTPSSANAWGGASCKLIKRWIEEGRIRIVGMAPMSAAKSRGRQSPQYEVVG